MTENKEGSSFLKKLTNGLLDTAAELDKPKEKQEGEKQEGVFMQSLNCGCVAVFILVWFVLLLIIFNLR